MRKTITGGRFGAGLLATLTLILLPAAGCGIQDNVTLPTIWDITYTLEISGDSSVSELTYLMQTGERIVSDPQDGWLAPVTAGVGIVIGATAEGVVQNGTITLAVRASARERPLVEYEDSCSESKGIPTDCMLALPTETLH